MKFQLEEDEILYLENNANLLRGGMKVSQGAAYLTSRRLVFCKRSFLWTFFLGFLLAALFKSKKIWVTIPLNEIQSIHMEKHGLAKKYVLQVEDGNAYAFQFLGFWKQQNEKWVDTIGAAIKTHVDGVSITAVEDRIEFAQAS
ncbi:GRAM domain-containing protein [Desulfoluna sp.]|uniref:GRAM domain-containing protein n=1 Tax=Desulfoluna sp. TaxID=2045199 RepID=UPI002619952C|nr:GRAM domain-containing protein [Desulfoluna sp.]